MAVSRTQGAIFGTDWTRAELNQLAGLVGGTEDGVTDRNKLAVTYPVTGDEVGDIPLLTQADVEQAVERSRAAVSEWQDISPDERAEIFDRFAALVEQHRDELLDLIQLETGKARQHAVEEFIDVPMTASYYAEKGPELLADEKRAGAVPVISRAEVTYDPVGVVGIISPWNYPFNLSMTDLLPALMAGNGVVLKPDEKTPFVALRLVELLIEAGVPEDVCIVVTGDGPVVGNALVDAVDYITFTGSSETGRIVAEQAGRNLIDCSMELGGKNPMVVLDDADIDLAARGAVHGCFTNAGQLCLSMERIYAREEIFEEFLESFVAETEQLTLGGDFDYTADIGSLIDEGQLERVANHVEDARERGATVHTGGTKRPDIGPLFYEPTILTDVPDDSLPACEETFGPVVRVEPVSSTGDAIEAANDTDYGLNASVWTADRSRGHEIARQIESGTVCVNDAYAIGWAAVDAPMGGVGDSGIGRRHGPEGLKRYVEPKTIASSALGPMNAPPAVPDSLFARGMIRSTQLLRKLKKSARNLSVTLVRNN